MFYFLDYWYKDFISQTKANTHARNPIQIIFRSQSTGFLSSSIFCQFFCFRRWHVIVPYRIIVCLPKNDQMRYPSFKSSACDSNMFRHREPMHPVILLAPKTRAWGQKFWLWSIEGADHNKPSGIILLRIIISKCTVERRYTE